MLSELSSIQKFATCSETSEYDKQSTLTWLSPFIFISKKPFSLKVIRIKTKFAEKILFKLLIFLYFKTIYGICRFEKIVRLKIHPVGKNNFNASSKSSTTPYDRWVQAILQPSNVVRRCTWVREWSSGWSWRRTILADLKARSTNISIILHLW